MKNKKFFLTLLIAVFLVISIILLYLFTTKFNHQITSLIGIKTNNESTSSTKPSPFVHLNQPINYNSVLADAINNSKCDFPADMKDTLLGHSMVPGVKDGATTVDDYWILNSVNPIVLNYVNFDGIDYMIGGLKDTTGTCKKIAFVIDGNFNVEDKSGLYKPYQMYVDYKPLNIDQYKEKFPIGSQVEAYFLTKHPDATLLVDELCNYRPPASQYYCAVQRITELFTKTFIDPQLFTNIFKFPSDSEQIYIVNSVSISK